MTLADRLLFDHLKEKHRKGLLSFEMVDTALHRANDPEELARELRDAGVVPNAPKYTRKPNPFFGVG